MVPRTWLSSSESGIEHYWFNININWYPLCNNHSLPYTSLSLLHFTLFFTGGAENWEWRLTTSFNHGHHSSCLQRRAAAPAECTTLPPIYDLSCSYSNWHNVFMNRCKRRPRTLAPPGASRVRCRPWSPPSSRSRSSPGWWPSCSSFCVDAIVANILLERF